MFVCLSVSLDFLLFKLKKNKKQKCLRSGTCIISKACKTKKFINYLSFYSFCAYKVEIPGTPSALTMHTLENAFLSLFA